MENSNEKENIIYRVRLMELYFDTVRAAYGIDPSLLREEGPVYDMLSELAAYYDSEQWLADYEADESGLLPEGLKRGVLSQDALYDFLLGITDTE